MIVARVLGLDEFWELPAIPTNAAAADKPSDDDTVAAAASDSEATVGLFWSSDDEPVDDEPRSEPQQSALALVEIVNSKGNRNVELSVDTKRGSLRVMENKPGSKGNRCGGCPTKLSVAGMMNLACEDINNLTHLSRMYSVDRKFANAVIRAVGQVAHHYQEESMGIIASVLDNLDLPKYCALDVLKWDSTEERLQWPTKSSISTGLHPATRTSTWHVLVLKRTLAWCF